MSDKPVRILHGSLDNFDLIEPCRSYMDRMINGGKDVKLIEYPDAHHGFDIPALRTSLIARGAITVRHCQLAEADDHAIINRETQKPFTYSDACVEKGVTFAHNEAATSQARLFARDFLTQVFHLKQ